VWGRGIASGALPCGGPPHSHVLDGPAPRVTDDGERREANMTDKTAADMLRELDAAATPGPWNVSSTEAVGGDLVAEAGVASIWAPTGTISGGSPDERDRDEYRDAAAIIALRNAAPALADLLMLFEAQVGAEECTCWSWHVDLRPCLECRRAAALAAVTAVLGGSSDERS